jgi:hypothetical protein
MASADAGPGPGPGAVTMLSYGGGNLFGRDSLTIDAAGVARFEYRSGDGRVTRGGPVQLTPAELRALEKLLARHKACDLRSAAGYTPVPEETQTSLTLELGSLHCTVSLYANEWRNQPAAAPIEKAIGDLSLRVQRAHPP